jgi:hypothetical protein
MNWQQTNRADLRVGPLADRHYNRQSIGHRQFVPPGRCVVLHTEDYDALWGKPPLEGLITFVDPKKVRPKANPGYCFLRAGFTICGSTPKGLIVLRCAPENFPKGETI